MQYATMMATLGLLVAVGSAGAAHLRALTTYQPTQTENGIVIVPVTFLVVNDDFSPGHQISYVCRPYLLPLLNQWNSADLVNHNVASQAAISAKVVGNLEERRLLFGDTLRVSVDLTETRPIAMSPDVVDATVEAVLRTAAMSCRGGERDPSWVDLRISGPPDYCGAARVYACEELPK